jgi:hypothetical protein
MQKSSARDDYGRASLGAVIEFNDIVVGHPRMPPDETA